MKLLPIHFLMVAFAFTLKKFTYRLFDAAFVIIGAIVVYNFKLTTPMIVNVIVTYLGMFIVIYLLVIIITFFLLSPAGSEYYLGLKRPN